MMTEEEGCQKKRTLKLLGREGESVRLTKGSAAGTEDAAGAGSVGGLTQITRSCERGEM